MEIVLIIIGAAIVLWIDYLIAREFYRAAEAKGYAETKYLWLCFLLGAVGYMLVIALPDRNNTPKIVADELPDL